MTAQLYTIAKETFLGASTNGKLWNKSVECQEDYFDEH